MRAGQLYHAIVIEQKTMSVDDNGDRTETWTTFHECYASISTGNGRELFAAKQTFADLSHNVVIRFKAGIKHEMRVKFADPKAETTRYFNIRAVMNPDERNEMLELQASEVIG